MPDRGKTKSVQNFKTNKFNLNENLKLKTEKKKRYRVSMRKLVPNIDLSWLSKRKTLHCLPFNKSMGLDPFNGEALELLLAAISHSEPKWEKWGRTQKHHSFIHQRELRVEVNTGRRV